MSLQSIVNEIYLQDSIRVEIDLWLTGQWSLQRKRKKESITFRNFKYRDLWRESNLSIDSLRSLLYKNLTKEVNNEINKPIIEEASEYLKSIYSKYTDQYIRNEVLFQIFKNYCFEVKITLSEVLKCLTDKDCNLILSKLSFGEIKEENQTIIMSYNLVENNEIVDEHIFTIGKHIFTLLKDKCNKITFDELENEDPNEDTLKRSEKFSCHNDY